MRAAAFWACWSFLIWDSVIPYNKALPLSRLIKAWTSFAAVSSSSTFLILFMFRIWKYLALHTFVRWASIESALSNTIPKLRALGEATISEDAIWRLFVLVLDWWYLEVMTRLISFNKWKVSKSKQRFQLILLNLGGDVGVFLWVVCVCGVCVGVGCVLRLI